MKRTLVGLAVAVLASGCWDFQRLLDDCADGGGVCGYDGGTGGGSGGGGTDAGSDAGAVDAGDGDAGRAVDAGPLCPLLDEMGAGLGATLTQPDGGTSFCFNGFQWENPLPHGDTLWSVSGAAPDDVWAAGTANMLMHWDGRRWSSFQGAVPPNTLDAFLTGVLMLPDGGGWLAGLHAPPYTFVGGGWQPVGDPPTGNYDGLALSPDGRIVVLVDLSGNVWTNGAQTVIGPGAGTFLSIGGVAVANDGGCWFATSTGNTVSLTRCGGATTVLDAGTAAGPLWVRPDGRFAFSYQTLAGSWVQLIEEDGGWSTPVASANRVFGVGSLPDGGGLLVGENWFIAPRDAPGAALPVQGKSDLPWRNLHGIAPFGDGGAWAVGEGGALVYEEVGAWQPRQAGPLDYLEGLLVEPNRVIAVGSNALSYTLGDAPQTGVAGAGELFDVAPTRDGGLLYAGRGALFSATGLHVLDVASGDAVSGLYTAPSGYHWAVGQHTLVFEDGTGWHPVDGGADVSWSKVDGEGSLVVAVGVDSLNGGVVFLAPGGVAAAVNQALYGVWVESDADGGLGWLVGQDLGVWRLEGGAATAVNVQVRHAAYGDLSDVWGFDPNDVWAVGQSGMVLHYRGGAWTQVEAGTRNHLSRVRGRQLANGQRELFIVGDFGTVLRYRYTP